MHFVCDGLRVALDNPRGDVSFVSHAHSDHTSGIKKQKKIVASKETIALAELNHAESLSLPGARLLDAGHIFGSRQLFIEEDGKSSVYTGDISLKKNIFGGKAEIPQCDRLVIEATYASSPTYQFPAHEDIYSDIAKWVSDNENSNLLIGVYEMGKAQEMIKILNEYASVAPIVTEKTGALSAVVEKFGHKLDCIVVGSEEAEEMMKKRFVALVPMRRAKIYFARKMAEAFERETLCAVATGWALTYRFNADVAFPLSDHADFFELKQYIEESGAREIEFFAGDGSRLLNELKNPYLSQLSAVS